MSRCDALVAAYRRNREMDEHVFERAPYEGKISAEDVLRKTAADRVDEVVEMLLRYLPYHEVRGALYERICHAPLADVIDLTIAYYKHCEHAPSIASVSKRDAHRDARQHERG
jgi:hypothetical protein